MDQDLYLFFLIAWSIINYIIIKEIDAVAQKILYNLTIYNFLVFYYSSWYGQVMRIAPGFCAYSITFLYIFFILAQF